MSAAPLLPDRQTILAGLSAGAHAMLDSLSVSAETGSTQSDALATATPAQGCAVFVSDRQSSGQGRRGRAWISPPAANLYLSLSRCFRPPMAALSGLSLAVGVAVAEALRGQGFAQVGVKWPNDLIAGGRKLGGILIQLRGDGQAGTLVVIGLGINLRMPASAAAQIDQAWCDLSQLAAHPPSRDALAAAVLDALLPALEQFEIDGLAPFLPRWRALDALAGQPVRIVDGAREHAGLCAGITDAGALRLLADGHEQIFHGGEVSLRPA